MSRRGPWRGGAALAETSRKSHDPSKPRLTTSAMIASLGLGRPADKSGAVRARFGGGREDPS